MVNELAILNNLPTSQYHRPDVTPQRMACVGAGAGAVIEAVLADRALAVRVKDHDVSVGAG